MPRKSMLPILLLALPVLGSGAASPAGEPDKSSWTVGILVMDGIYNTELVGPYDVFSHAKPFRVVTIAPAKRELKTAEGIRFLPDHDFTDHPPIDILVIPSFVDYQEQIRQEEIVGWIRDRGEKADWVLSHCWGAFYLAAAGFLDGREAMTFPPDIDKFAAMFPKVRTRKGFRFVRDGKFITSAGGVASYESPLYLVRILAGDEAARRVARGLVIPDWRLEKIPYLER